MQDSDLLSINIHGDVSVTVPDSLDLITSYVLLEQEQWFETEVQFIRKLLRPGMAVIDIGANYGCYALMMARAIGDEGHLWAFEPTSATADCLSKSIKGNSLKNVTLIQAALSDMNGTAAISINPNSELNSLTIESDCATEEVTLMTLDQCNVKFGWHNIDFVKLDAEGEEGRILLGGTTFLEEESPLIMFELKHQQAVNVSLIDQFTELGYHAYRLVPGLEVLVPFSVNTGIDDYQLNLFCCKNDRATRLKEEGLLITDDNGAQIPIVENKNTWQAPLFTFPYAVRFWRTPEKLTIHAKRDGFHEYTVAIEQFFEAHREDNSPSECYNALRESLRLLESSIMKIPHISRLCTYARVAGELGERSKQNKVLGLMLDMIQIPGKMILDEPLLPACTRFDRIDPFEHQLDWFVTSLLEQWETCNYFSSYYSGASTLNTLESINDSRFQSAEMARRLQLVRMRAGKLEGAVPSELLLVRSAENLNPDYWKSNVRINDAGDE